MRIVTWNCNRSFAKKSPHLLALEPDVALLQECEQGFKPPEGYRYLWTGLNPAMGLGILTRDFEARIEPEPEPGWTFFLPVVLPTFNLRVLAVWAFHNRAARIDAARTGSINTVLDSLGPWLQGGRSLMAGDFNHNLRWDTPRGKNNFRPMVHRLRDLGLRSAYHEASLEGFDKESKPTHLFRRKAEAEYHIDYCFLHHSLPFQSVEILAGEPWTGLSDHLPLVVDLKAH